jgi:hypothetical protein
VIDGSWRNAIERKPNVARVQYMHMAYGGLLVADELSQMGSQKSNQIKSN